MTREESMIEKSHSTKYADAIGHVLPVIIGGTMLSYSYVRELNRQYGIDRCIVIISDDIKMLSSSKFVDCKIIDNVHDDDVLLSALDRISQEERAADPTVRLLALGCDDRHAIFFSQHADELHKLGFSFSFNDPDMLLSISQKKNFYELCDRLHVPYAKIRCFPASVDGPKRIENDLGFPVILKPSDSTAFQNATVAGKRKVYEIESEEELDRVWESILASDYEGDMILQTFIPGEDESLFAVHTYSDSQGNVKVIASGTVCLQDHSPDALGNSVCVLCERDQTILDNACKIVRKLGFKGYANFDVRRDASTGVGYFLEMNIRAGRPVYMVSLGGLNFTRPIVEDLILGLEVKEAQAFEPYVFSCIPKYVIKRSVHNKVLLDKTLSTLRRTHPNPYPLYYSKDSISHNFWAWLMKMNQILKFKRFYWDTDGAQLR